MVEERKVNVKRHLTALIITLGVFIIGVLLGLLLTKERSTYLDDIASTEKLGYDSLQLQYIFLTSSAQEKNCPALISTLEESTKTLEDSRKKLESFVQDSYRSEDYDLLKRNYVLSELRLWLFAKTTREICKNDNVRVLFFYSNDKGDTQSAVQGTILTSLKETFGDKLLVFSIDFNFKNEPMVDILKNTYLITETPTIILEETKFTGLATRDKLIENICNNLKDKPEICP